MLKLRIREIGLKNLECVGRLGRETMGRRERSNEREGKGKRNKGRVRYGLEGRKGSGRERGIWEGWGKDEKRGEGKEEYWRDDVRMRRQGKGKRNIGGMR